MTGNRDPNVRPGRLDIAGLALFSILTAGMLPFVMWSYTHSRQRRLRQFVMHGVPAIARVLDMEKKNIAFKVKMTRVRYEFEAGGRIHRDVDSVLPTSRTMESRRRDSHPVPARSRVRERNRQHELAGTRA